MYARSNWFSWKVLGGFDVARHHRQLQLAAGEVGGVLGYFQAVGFPAQALQAFEGVARAAAYFQVAKLPAGVLRQDVVGELVGPQLVYVALGAFLNELEVLLGAVVVGALGEVLLAVEPLQLGRRRLGVQKHQVAGPALGALQLVAFKFVVERQQPEVGAAAEVAGTHGL
jgi:hypothetical protein